MTPQQWALLLAIVSALVTAYNAWGRLQMRNEVLDLRLHISENYVSKETLEHVVQRLERLLDRLEQRMEGNKR